MRKILFNLAHVLVIVLCFTVDVKVRADALHPLETVGECDVDTNPDLSTDVETFSGALIRFSQDDAYLALKQKTFATISSNNLQLHYGTLFVRKKSDQPFTVKTREGVVVIKENSEVLVKSEKNKVTVSVLSGSADLQTLSGTQKQELAAGYSSWLGGMEPNGKHALGPQTALDFNETADDFSLLGGIAKSDQEVATDHLRITWKKAVDEVADRTQAEVSKNMKIVERWRLAKNKQAQKEEKLRLKIKEYYRAHALGLPDQNTEFPSESPRSPANEN